ncbi:hypothetical protein AK812_SmicGene45149 [Symbiodinium microadriaticum]|uniref:Uncharacterized protein n=1 Tax=Symbiodinium microadriaticum TaxID=2951 RepID=A0A1Q9BWQ8_SYMMI|nr:hypothetical protein AK812_SmicGene45149 [Symbiodinium microadriaticum]
MGRPKKPEYDLDFVRNPGLPPEQVASELSHALRLKGADIPGEAVASLRARVEEFATMAAASAAGATLPTAREDYLIQGGDSSDVDAQLTEDDCTNWIHTLSRARLMLIYFFGKAGDCNGSE